LIILFFITVVAGWLRFTATTFGIPALFRPDEQILIYPALHFRGGDLNPHTAIYPASQIYVLHAALRVYAAAKSKWSNFDRFYDGDHYALAHVIGRRVSATFGTATVPAIYIAASPIFGVPAALASATLLSVSPIHVRDSKFATADVAAAFWITLAAAMILRIASDGGLRYYILAGLFSGLATSTKYQAVPIIFGVAASHFETCSRTGRSLLHSVTDRRIYLAALTTIVAFFSGTPYLFFDWAQTRNDYAIQMNAVTRGGFAGAGNGGYGSDWLFLHAMPACSGKIIEVLMLIALGWALLSRKRGAISLAVFVGFTFFSLVESRLLYYRYLLVAVPALVLLLGLLIGDVFEFISARLGKAPSVALTVLGLAALLAPLLVDDVQLNKLLLRADTRILASQWIDSNIPRGASIAVVENGTPYGKPQLNERNLMFPFESCASLRRKNVFWVLSDNYPPIHSQGLSLQQSADLEANATLAFDYNPLLDDDTLPIFDPSDAFYAPLRQVSGVKRPGPRIRIWRLKVEER